MKRGRAALAGEARFGARALKMLQKDTRREAPGIFLRYLRYTRALLPLLRKVRYMM